MLYTPGDQVRYDGDLPCDDTGHTGTVEAVTGDASGDQVVTVQFDCGLHQDILASELKPGNLARRTAARGRLECHRPPLWWAVQSNDTPNRGGRLASLDPRRTRPAGKAREWLGVAVARAA